MRYLRGTLGFLGAAGCLATMTLPAYASTSTPNADEDFGSQAEHPGLVDAARVVPGLMVELVYATAENFTNKPLYGELRRCFLQKDAARMLKTASEALLQACPKCRLLAYDCTRPQRVQRAMWDAVKGTSKAAYVANPNTAVGSIHNYGCAIDLTVVDADGKPLDMGTPFDHLGKEAEPRHEAGYLQAGKLTHHQVANRLLLRWIMVRAGFYPLNNEWWHFNCAPTAVTRKRYKPVR